MAKYMIQVAYSPEAWAAMVRKPQNRMDAVRPVVESLGGTFEDAWIAFGKYDLVGIVDLPANADAAAFAMAVSSGGSVKAFRTTPLLSLEEGVEAMKKAGKVRYRPPAAKKST